MTSDPVPPPAPASTAAAAAGEPRGAPGRLRFGALERRLFLVVLVGLLPLTLLAFATLLQTARDQQRQVIESGQSTMRALMTAVDADQQQTIAALDTLAASPRLAAGDLAGLREEALQLMARRPTWANVVLSTPQAQQVMNARLAAGQPLPARVDADSVGAVARSGQPRIGHLVFSPVLGKHVFGVLVPVLRQGSVAYVLSAVIKPEAMQELLERQRVPATAVVAIIDARRRVVARSRNVADFLGQPASPSLLSLMNERTEAGWGMTRTLEGDEVYTMFQRSPLSGWAAAQGQPAAEVEQPARSSYLALGGSVLLSALLGVVAAMFFGRTITRPMGQLRQAALALARGQPPQLPASTLAPVRDVGQALAAAHVEREQRLQAERAARHEAEQASRAKDEFLAMLGHELRNPLAAITNAARVLDRVAADPASRPGVQARQVIGRQVRHLGRLTDDLLDAGRVMLGKIELQARPLDLAAVVQQAVGSLRHGGVFGGHELTLALQPAWVHGDPTRLEQAVSNLAGNAAKYTPAPGRLRISVQCEGGEAVLYVADSGIGIEPELLPQVFDLFVQGRRSLDRAQGGLGIGLTLVRRIVELHGGRVSAHSAGPGQGSEFVVRLPAVAAPQQPGAPAASAGDGGPRRVVVVEDNADVRAMLRTLLEIDGHEVHEAADGPAGVAAILLQRPDLALVDVGLPGLDGYGVVAAVRAAGGPLPRLVALTGYGAQADVQRGLQAGFDHYLVKPVDADQLASMVAGSPRVAPSAG